MEDEDEQQQQLDLDTLLRSHILTSSSSSDDDDIITHSSLRHHRTVDEILLNHSSPSSSPPSSPPPSTSSTTDVLPHSQSLDISKLVNTFPLTNNNSIITRASSSIEFPSINNNNNNLGRAWFSGVRSNAKPGAALAAAAAASRSIPRRQSAIRIVPSTGSSGLSTDSESLSANRSSTEGISDDRNEPEILVKGIADGGGFNESFKAKSDSNSRELLGDKVNDDRNGAEILLNEIADGGGFNESFEAKSVSTSGELLGDNVNDDRNGAKILVKEIADGGRFSESFEAKSVSTSGELLGDNVNDDRNEAEILVNEIVDGGFETIDEDSRRLLVDKVVNEHDDLSRVSSSVEPDFELHDHVGKGSLESVEKSPMGSTAEFQSMDNEGEIEDDTIEEVQLKSSEVSDKGISESVGESNGVEEVLVTQSNDGEEDGSSSHNDVVDMVGELTMLWESRRGSRIMQKRSESSLKLLELAEELERKEAFTGLHLEEGAAALPMRLEGVRRGSDELGYFDVDAHNFITQKISSEAFRGEHGSPLVLAVHVNYIAIGMSRGVVVVVSSKYTPHHADKMDTKMRILGHQANRSYAPPVTSMCFNQQGDLLFAGYGDGHYTVWDVQRESALKIINEHKAPVVHLLYLGQNNVVSGDIKGIVKLIHFSLVPLLNRISYSSPTKLLDESTSTVVCAVPLVSSEVHSGTSGPSQGSNSVSTGGISSMMGGVVGGDSGWKLFDGYSTIEEGVVIFITNQSALVAKLNPSIEVYAQLPKPEGVRDGAMPYAAWKYMVVSKEVSAETSDRVALLAIAWDKKVQVAKLVKSELKVYGKWDLVAPAVGVVWLSDQLLVVLTSIGQMCLFSRDGDLIHQTSFAMDRSPRDDLISSHTYFANKLGNPEKAHHNCLMVRGAKVYILGSMHLAISRLLPWRERIEVLQRAGDWMGALYMAMTFYDGQAQAVIDLPRNLIDVQKTVMPFLLQLLFSYVDEVFSYISVACGKQDERPDPSIEHYDECSIDDEAKEQYSRVGGVAVEFCLHINRTDILFDEIYSRFGKIKHQETFLEILEPYILKDMLGSLPPEIMQALVEHYSRRGWLQRVEQCVLHMDILSLDFNQVVRICREHRLHGALIYLFNKGLDDFKTPLEELLVVLQNSLIESVPTLGYRILIYLKYCFQGMAFPPGHGNIPPARLLSLRNELVQFLLESSSAPSPWSVSSISFDEGSTYLHNLLEFDTGSTLDVLKLAFVEDENVDTKDLSQDSINSDGRLTEAEDDLISKNQELIQKLIDVLCDILDMSYFQTSDSTDSDDRKSVEIWPSKNDVKYLFDFIAYYVACKRAKVQKIILNKIVEYMTSEIDSSPVVPQQNLEVLKRREMQLLAFLEAIPVAEWDVTYFLDLCLKAQFHKACGLINAIGHHYSAALDCYMNVKEEPIHAFSFIHDILQKSDNESINSESTVISRIPHLVRLSREGTFFMVLYHFPAKTEQIMSELHSHPESLLLYLKTVFEVHSKGSLDFSHLRKCEMRDLSCGKGESLQSDRIETFLSGLLDFPKLVRGNTIQITDEITELYLELLCRYERESVLKFLETFESYRVDRCLRLCQEFGIVDAAAFLLERVGDVGSALLLHLSDLNHKFVMLGETFDSESSDAFDPLLKKKEVHDILETVRACVELCQRNSPRLEPHEAEFLWFQLLDSVCEPLIAEGEGNYYTRETPDELLDLPSRKLQGDGANKAKWKIPITHRSAHTLKKLFSIFIKEIVEGMIGYVRLPEIMLKLLSDNGTQEFGDFKPTILGMLGTYDFERKILDTAKCLIEDDTYYTMSLLKKGASHGYALHSLSCCICNCLVRNTSGPGVRVYSCGHATHLHCEIQDTGTSVSGSTGCPICMPKKKGQQSKSKSGLLENGLVNTSSTRAQHTQGTNFFHLHDYDAFENFQNSNQISRFELLHNLQKDKTAIQIENMPQLRLAPPSVYHDKVKKGPDMVRGESSGGTSKMEKLKKGKALRDVKVKASSIRFPLKSTIFGKEKVIKQR